MYIPTQKQWATVIEKLYSVLPFALQQAHSLNMMQTEVNDIGHKCGTTHCVGGWYAVAHWQYTAFTKKHGILDYRDGATAMARDLGFSDMYYLRHWADLNPHIWGNCRGTEMFGTKAAYDHGNGPAIDLADVIRHFEFVADNCKKARQ